MDSNYIITIGRQYGSGGRKIGLLLSQMLDIPFYDRKLITEAVRRSGLSHEYLERGDEKRPGLWKQLFSPGVGFSPEFGQEELFRIQAETILEIADKGPCVIVGRCADYVLRNNPRCFNVFICADLQSRIGRVASRHDITVREAEDMIVRTDRARAAYYTFYTDKQWGQCVSYHLCIDSSVLGLEGSAAVILDFVKAALDAEK